MNPVWEGILIGSAGGAFAGITVYAIQYFHTRYVEKSELKRVEGWMLKNVSIKDGKEFRFARTIASFNNLTIDRVRYLCSISKIIYLSTGAKDDRWGLEENRKKTQ